MTYSIVARADNGELGVASASYLLGVGGRTIYGEAGVGVVVTQMFHHPPHGYTALAALRRGVDASSALAEAIAADPAPPLRQLGVIDGHGRTAVHTGSQCIPFAEYARRDRVAAFGAMLEQTAIPDAMIDAFERASGSVETRLLTALRAAQERGGDVRGIRAAVLRVYDASPEGGLRLDVRVDQSAKPLDTLAALITQQNWVMRAESAFALLASGNVPAALAAFDEATAAAPDDPDVAVRHGIALALSGDVSGARRRFDVAYRDAEGWRESVRRLAPAGLLPNDESLLERLTR